MCSPQSTSNEYYCNTLSSQEVGVSFAQEHRAIDRVGLIVRRWCFYPSQPDSQRSPAVCAAERNLPRGGSEPPILLAHMVRACNLRIWLARKAERIVIAFSCFLAYG